MKNCQGLDQTKLASLRDLWALLLSLFRRKKLPSSIFNDVYNQLANILKGKYAAGLNGSDLKGLVDQYLPGAVSNALQNANSAGGANGAAQGIFGSGVGVGGSALAGLASGNLGAGSFFDPTRTDPSTASVPSSIASQVGSASSSNVVGGVAVGGLPITSEEIRDYFNGYVRQDDDSFAILLWLGSGKNPMLMLEALSYAKRLHNDIILPAATYYKQLIFGDPNYPIRLGQILYGIVPQLTVVRNLQGGPPSRHLLGQAVNFQINSVQNDKVVEDLAAGAIQADFGTLALTSGIHASLPFYAANDAVVRKMLLWTDNGVPNFVGYRFT